MLTYNKLWVLLEKKGMKKTDLKQVISGNTLAKLGKNEPISSTVIEKICAFLKCQPGDIMEYVSEETLNEVAKQLDDITKKMMESLKAQGISEEEFIGMLLKEIPGHMRSIANGGNPVSEAVEEYCKSENENTPKQ